MKNNASPLGDMAGLLQLLPLLAQAGGGMQDIGALAQLSLQQQQQQQQGDYQDQRNQLYTQSINQRATSAEEQRRMELAKLALQQQTESRRAQEFEFQQGMDLSNLGMKTQNAQLDALYKQKLMESMGISSQGKLLQQQLLQSMFPQGGQPGAQPAAPRQPSPEELMFLQSLQQ